MESHVFHSASVSVSKDSGAKSPGVEDYVVRTTEDMPVQSNSFLCKEEDGASCKELLAQTSLIY